VLVDLVLVLDDRQYWRIRRTLPAVPDTGTVLQVLGDLELDATVTGSTWPLAGDEHRSTAAAILVRTSTTTQGVSAALRRDGWHQLL